MSSCEQASQPNGSPWLLGHASASKECQAPRRFLGRILEGSSQTRHAGGSLGHDRHRGCAIQGQWAALSVLPHRCCQRAGDGTLEAGIEQFRIGCAAADVSITAHAPGASGGVMRRRCDASLIFCWHGFPFVAARRSPERGPALRSGMLSRPKGPGARPAARRIWLGAHCPLVASLRAQRSWALHLSIERAAASMWAARFSSMPSRSASAPRNSCSSSVSGSTAIRAAV